MQRLFIATGVLIIGIVAIAICSTTQCTQLLLGNPINSFEDCKSAGNTITTDSMRKCTDDSGVVFIDNNYVVKQQKSSSGIQGFAQSQSSAISLKNTTFDPLNNTKVSLPVSVRLDVPFTPQAPTADWNPPFDEACEEASLLMVVNYNNNTPLTTDRAVNQITQIVNWQTNNGYNVDISIAELQQVAKSYLQLDSKAYENDEVNIVNIKQLLAQGYPVIIPAAGQQLGNPYFSGDGPPYHMLVITGYDAKNFFTNDPGTKRGQAFKYTYATILNAIHDWNGSIDTINSGKKSMLVLKNSY